MHHAKEMTQSKRLLALDILRGITIAGMILVNNPGTWGSIYAPLEHASWHGLTPTDLVFPFFMFIMGVSTYFSLRKYEFRFTGSSVWKVVKRSLVILLIGWGVAWLSLMLRRFNNPDYTITESILSFTDIRTLGVLPRLAICYCVSSLIALALPHKWVKWIIGIFLVGYSLVLFLGNGLVFSADNIIAIVDRSVIGEAHMYADTIDGVTLKFDPEGLLSTIPSIAHCLIGFLCGAMIVKIKNNETRALNLLIIGAILTMAGFLLSYGMPINKKIWSPTFVLTTCGLASLLLGVLIWAIDIKGHKRWCQFFEVFGINPLFLYTLSAVLSILFNFIHWPMEGITGSVHNVIFALWLKPMCGPYTQLASLLYALIFVCINWAVGLILYKKKIYIKI